MKTSIDSYYRCLDFGEEGGLRMIRDAGFDMVDYSLFHPEKLGGLLDDDYMEKAAHTKALLKEIGLGIYQAHAPFDMKYGMAFDVSDPVFLGVVRSMEYAAYIGAKVIVVHGIRVPDVAEMIDYNEGYYKALAPYCEKFNIRIAVENLVTSAFYTPELLDAMMARLDPKWFTICLDLGHAQLQHMTTGAFLRKIGPGRISCLHVHDNDGVGDLHRIPFTGIMDWDDTIAALKEIGYAGDMSLEINFVHEELPMNLRPAGLRLCGAAARELAMRMEQ